MSSLVDRYTPRIAGQLLCLDRVVIMGTLPGACYAQGMTHILYRRGVRIFDYAQFAKPLADRSKPTPSVWPPKRASDRVRQEAQQLSQGGAGTAGSGTAWRTSRSGAYLFGTGAVPAYQPWHDKGTGKTFLKPDSGKCLHYYFYFIDPVLGLCYLRVPTYCPFRLQFYFNGHNWLKAQLDRCGIACELIDNVIVACQDWTKAQQLADGFEVKALHRLLDRYAKLYCPAAPELGRRGLPLEPHAGRVCSATSSSRAATIWPRSTSRSPAPPSVP